MIDQRNEILALLNSGSSFLVVSHENPDGDCIGATLALTLALQGMGKRAVAFNDDFVPHYLRWLAGADELVHTADPAAFDVVCVLDCGAPDRIGKLTERVLAHPRVIDIDHHGANEGFGLANYVAPTASSTSKLLHGVLKFLGAELTPGIATCLYLGIYTDTNMFKNANSTPEAYQACGELVAAGAESMTVAKRVYIETTAERLQLMARVLSTLQIDDDGRIAGMVCTQRDLHEFNAKPEDLETFVEHPRAIIGVRAAYLLRELEDGVTVKGSLRSNDDIDVAEVAATLGGGGHVRAAGFRAKGTIAEVRALLVEKLRRAVADQ